MALAITSPVATVADTSNVTSYATASFTPTHDALLVVYAMANASVATGSISGGSLSWTLVQRVIGSGDTQWIWWAQAGASPSSMTITVDLTGDAATGCFIKTVQITGHDTVSPVAQFVLVTNNTTSANPSITLSQAMNTNNLYMAFFSNNTNPFAGTESSGWTETDDTGMSTPASGLHVSYRIGGETASSVTITAVSSNWKSAFIEIAVLPVAGISKNLATLGVG